MESPSVFLRYREPLKKELRSFLSNRQPEQLYRMLRYHLGWEDARGDPQAGDGGKMLRPVLCLLACEAVGGEWRRALPAAVAVELLHNFSLVHDDIQDRDRERRHRPTVWSLWGEAQGINAGDALLALARLAVLRLADEGLEGARVVQAARILDERTLEMVEGQVLDLSFEERLDIGLEEYLAMIQRKTGALFECALRLGALVGNDDLQLAEALGRYGRLLGVVFQVRDDMLGVWGAESQTGKPPAADIRQRKKSLPVVYALANAEGATAEELSRVYSQPEMRDEDVSLVLRTLDSLGAHAYCRGLAEERREAAVAELDRMGLVAEELKEVTAFMLERDF